MDLAQWRVRYRFRRRVPARNVADSRHPIASTSALEGAVVDPTYVRARICLRRGRPAGNRRRKAIDPSSNCWVEGTVPDVELVQLHSAVLVR